MTVYFFQRSTSTLVVNERYELIYTKDKYLKVYREQNLIKKDFPFKPFLLTVLEISSIFEEKELITNEVSRQCD